jgi:hypothetical protein
MAAIRDLVDGSAVDLALRPIDEMTGQVNRLPLAASTALFGARAR